MWVDLGLPVRHTTDGRAYKPLFAVLFLDMDGRLNLNAHGSSAQTGGGYYNSPNVHQYQSVMPPVLSNLDSGPGSTQLPGALGAAAANQAFFAGPVGTHVLHAADQYFAGTGHGTGGGQSPAAVPDCRRDGHFLLQQLSEPAHGKWDLHGALRIERRAGDSRHGFGPLAESGLPL